jgi:hypothetical protein
MLFTVFDILLDCKETWGRDTAYLIIIKKGVTFGQVLEVSFHK